MDSDRYQRLKALFFEASRRSEATVAATRALELARTHGERGHQALALRLLGEVRTRNGETALAEAHFREGLLLAEELGMLPLVAHCHRGLARTLDPKQAAAASHRDSAAALFQAMDMRPWGQM